MGHYNIHTLKIPTYQRSSITSQHTHAYLHLLSALS